LLGSLCDDESTRGQLAADASFGATMRSPGLFRGRPGDDDHFHHDGVGVAAETPALATVTQQPCETTVVPGSARPPNNSVASISSSASEIHSTTGC
jgi:hypothetical protein